MKYKHDICQSCGVAFEEGDDVVVCPECGSPHHRQCYRELGKCANSELHGTGFRYKKPEPVKPEVTVELGDKPEVICYHCRTLNPADAEECSKCGAPLGIQGMGGAGMNNGMDALKQLFNGDPSNKIDGVPMREVMGYVKTNLLYYIPLFKQMADMGRKVSFNLLCFIFPPVYFANRKMWFWAVLTTVISLVLAMPMAVSYLVGMGLKYPDQAFFSMAVNNAIQKDPALLNELINTCNVIDMVVRLVLCLFGNYIYYRHVIRSLKRIRTANGGDNLEESKLRGIGGVKLFNTVVILMVSFFLTAGALTVMKTFMDGQFLG